MCITSHRNLEKQIFLVSMLTWIIVGTSRTARCERWEGRQWCAWWNRIHSQY